MAIGFRDGAWVIESIYPNGNVSWVKHEVGGFGNTGMLARFHTYWTLPPGWTPTVCLADSERSKAP